MDRSPLTGRKAWPAFHDALPTIHGQGDDGTRDDARLRAKERLSYDELFSHQLTLSLIREHAPAGKVYASRPQATYKHRQG